MNKALSIPALALAALFGGAGDAEANACRSFERTVYEYGRATYQSGTECLNRWGVWETVAWNNYGTPYYGPATPTQVVYVDRQRYVQPSYSINLGFMDIDRKGGGRYYKRDNDRHHHHHGKGRGHDRH